MPFTPTLTRAHKNPARVATTTSIVLAGLQTIDGVALARGDRVLVKDNGVENGIYIAVTSIWARSPDADRDSDIYPGMQVFISEGTVNGNKYFFVSNDAPISLGTTILE